MLDEVRAGIVKELPQLAGTRAAQQSSSSLPQPSSSASSSSAQHPTSTCVISVYAPKAKEVSKLGSVAKQHAKQRAKTPPWRLHSPKASSDSQGSFEPDKPVEPDKEVEPNQWESEEESSSTSYTSTSEDEPPRQTLRLTPAPKNIDLNDL